MTLHIINTGSKGNSYALESSDKSILLLELGLHWTTIKKYIQYNVQNVVAALVTHEHGDHAKGVVNALADGILVCATNGTLAAIGVDKHHRVKPLTKQRIYDIGKWKVVPFAVPHDASEPCGFILKHSEVGTILFMTDAQYSEYTFGKVNHYIIEANYEHELLGTNKSFLRNRISESHMSIDQCINTLLANDLTDTKNIILTHLSDRNTNLNSVREKVQMATGKHVLVADNNQLITLS